MTEYQLLLATARKDLVALTEVCFRILNGGRAFVPNWHHQAYAKALDDIESGTRPRMVISTPPRSLKSITASVTWPAHLLGRNPERRVMVVSYSERLGQDLLSKGRRLMESAIFRDLYPGTVLSRATSEILETDRGGRIFMTWVGGPTTGFGADFIIFDDPHNASEIYSPAAREKVKTYFDFSLSQRFEDETEARIVIIMQRLHDDDLAGHVLRRTGWHHTRLQAQATVDTFIDIGLDQPFHFKKGQLMDPRRLPCEVLDRKRAEMGAVAYQAQYLQEPVPEQGNMIDKAWLRYEDPPPDRSGALVVLSLDTATKTDPANDYSACTVWLYTTSRHYLLDVWRDRVNFPNLRQKILDLIAVHGANTVLVEDQGTGSALIQELINLGLPAVPRRSHVPKSARLAGISSYIEAGLMVLPRDAHWLGEFVSELLVFPSGQYDDQVDTVSQYFEWVRTRPRPSQFSWDMGWNETAPNLDSLAESLTLKNTRFGSGPRFGAS